MGIRYSDRNRSGQYNIKKYEEKLKKNLSTSQDEKFIKPDRNIVMGMSDQDKYDKLNDDGYVPEETEVYDGEMVIGKVTPIEPGTGKKDGAYLF